MIGQLQRLLAMPGREVAFRTRELLRVQAERVRVSVAPPTWTRRDLQRILAPRVVEAPLRDALAADEWAEAGRLLRTAVLQRANRFVIDPRDARPLARAIEERWPDAVADAARSSGAILSGQHRILGYTSLSFADDASPIDWHFDPVHRRRAPVRFWADVPYLDSVCGDHKIIWEINRQQYFLALGRAYWLTRHGRYAARIVRDVRDWLAANPPLMGINWASMLELGLRSLSWAAATHFLLADVADERAAAGTSAPIDDAWLLDVFVGLDRQLRHVERHLSRYFSPNTHLTGEALALYVVGVAFPELAGSRQWTRTGKAILLEEIEAQINADGGHAELSTCYHRYTLDFYSLAALTAELEGDAAAATRFRQTVARLRDYLTAFADPNGLVPAIGDDDGGKLWGLSDRDPRDVCDALALAGVVADPQTSAATFGPADVPEEAVWLGWSLRPVVRQPQTERRRSRRRDGPLRVTHLRDSGYVVATTGRGDHLTFDVGPHGFRNGGHAHADALAVTLTLSGAPFLVDPGTATYTMDPALRNRLRDTAAHNTATIDGRPSAMPRGAVQWDTRATAQLASLRRNPQCLLAEGSHDGYAPAEHRRVIVHGTDTGWLIADFIDAGHDADLHWHFDPQWLVETATPHALRAIGPTGNRAWLIHEAGVSSLEHGGLTRGWCSPRYGALVPTFTARVHYESTAAPLTTWIGLGDGATAPDIAAVPVLSRSRAAAYRVRHALGTTLTVLHPATSWTAEAAVCGDTTSDARLLQLTTRTDGGVGLALADGRELTAPTLPFVDLSSDERLDDLSIDIRADVADLWTGTPPSGLWLRCADGWRPRRLRLNGRDTVGLLRGDRVDIPASCWSDPAGAAARPSVTETAPHPHPPGRLVDVARIVSEGHS
jgi:hypothetical protein